MKARRAILKLIGIAASVVLLLWGGGYAYFRSVYPYGWTHVCDTQLSAALHRYAEENGNAFPVGKATPEACLALLNRPPYEINAHVLSGKSVDTEVADAALRDTGTLSPQSCGWHYIPGLRLFDSPDLALFWDKTGLSHNGRKLRGGGHIVWFINGNRRHVPSNGWEEFLAAQDELRRNLRRD